MGSLSKEITSSCFFYDLGQKQQDFISSTFPLICETIIKPILGLFYIYCLLLILLSIAESLTYNLDNLLTISKMFIKLNSTVFNSSGYF